MKYPKFFDEHKITMIEPLGNMLGAFEDGIVEYTYLDAVKLAGHSCPTVSSTFAMLSVGLKKLYGNNIPVRGDMKVEIQGAKEDGSIGVIANVVSYITGACDEGGFKGFGGQSPRDNLLKFNPNIKAEIILTSISNGNSVKLSVNLDKVKTPEKLGYYMQKASSFDATDDDRKMFAELWQEKVKNVLAADIVNVS